MLGNYWKKLSRKGPGKRWVLRREWNTECDKPTTGPAENTSLSGKKVMLCNNLVLRTFVSVKRHCIVMITIKIWCCVCWQLTTNSRNQDGWFRGFALNRTSVTRGMTNDHIRAGYTRQLPGILSGWFGRLAQSTTWHSFGTYIINVQKHAEDTSVFSILLQWLTVFQSTSSVYGALVVTLAMLLRLINCRFIIIIIIWGHNR